MKKSRSKKTPKLSAKEKLELAKKRAKELAAQQKPRTNPEVDQEFINAQNMAVAYEKALGEYKNHKTLNFLKSLTVTEAKQHRNYNIFVRAVKFADELNVDYTTYVKAQFYYFDKHFNKAPKVRHIASYKTKVPAKERVRLFLKEKNSLKEKKVVGPVIRAPKIPDSVKDRYSDKQLKEFMKNYSLTEKEVFIRFAKGSNAYLYFDRGWLLKNETYQKLKNAGKV